MRYHYLGSTGLRVSELCLGAMTFGREADEATSREMMDTFAERGGNFIDTADVYGPGTSEEVVGRWLAGHDREDWVIATKVRFPSGEGPNDVGLSRKHIIATIDAALSRLGTEYVDILQIHCWDRGTPVEETLTTLDGLVRQGKVRYLGSSNLKGWQLEKFIATAERMGLHRFVCHQPQYNLLSRPTEWEVLEVCLAEGLGVIPWAPLRGGWLSGRYTRDMGGAPEGSRIKTAEREGWSETWQRYDNDHTWAIVDELVAVAAELDCHPAQVAIRWVAQRPAVTAPIIGASRLDQLRINLGSVDIELSDAQMARLTAVSDVTGDYPYDSMIAEANADR